MGFSEKWTDRAAGFPGAGGALETVGNDVVGASPPPVSDLSVSPPLPEATATDRAGGGLGVPPCAVCFHARGGGCHYRRWKGTGAAAALVKARKRCPMIYG